MGSYRRKIKAERIRTEKAKIHVEIKPRKELKKKPNYEKVIILQT